MVIYSYLRVSLIVVVSYLREIVIDLMSFLLWFSYGPPLSPHAIFSVNTNQLEIP